MSTICCLKMFLCRAINIMRKDSPSNSTSRDYIPQMRFGETERAVALARMCRIVSYTFASSHLPAVAKKNYTQNRPPSTSSICIYIHIIGAPHAITNLCTPPHNSLICV